MKQKKKQIDHTRRTTPSKSLAPAQAAQTFIEHVQELRRRLYYVAASVLVWGGTAYAVQQHIVALLLKPAHGQHFIYTNPGGGIDFLFKICIYSGLIISTPVIVYNTLRFIEPLITKSSRSFMIMGSLASGILALGGMVFGYLVGLPAALHFLLHQFTTVQIKPLVTIQSYLGFVIVYMVGSALLFQLPLLLLFINRITPLKPSKLLHYERWVILAAFLISGLMNPSPNVLSQLLVAGPFIIMYQIGIILIALVNRNRALTPVQLLHQQDVAAQIIRQQQAGHLQPVIAATPSRPVSPPKLLAPAVPQRQSRQVPLPPIYAHLTLQAP